jgi:tRNA nucleotidyltransferase (CCA-adding enzyme)
MPSLVTAGEIVRRLRRAGHEAYLAGGSVRDMLLGRTPGDYDIATSATPDEVRALFPRTVEVGAAFGVIRVVADDGEYEVATFRTEGPYLDGRHPSSVRYATAREDALRRDFTINGLFYDPETGSVQDFVGGRADLEARIVRTIGDPEARFAEDHLRMLRAVRQAAELGFEVAPETLAALRRLRAGLRTVSAERIRDEVVRILTGPDPPRGLALLRDTGLLEIVLPEVAAEIGVEQPEVFHPEGDVFEHTRLAVGQLRHPSVALAMATLLHDVGKPGTFRRADRIRFDRHDEVGAAIAGRVMERLRFSRREADRVTQLVGRHMIFKDLPHMREARLRRLLAEEAFPELLELHRVDCVASHGDLSTYEWVRERLARIADEPLVPPRLITGNDLIDLGLRPGPQIGEILRSVEDARLEGRVRTRDEALALARTLAGLPQPPSTPAEEPLSD